MLLLAAGAVSLRVLCRPARCFRPRVRGRDRGRANARRLGRFTILCRVVLPMARPALAVGVALAALETLNDIGASGISRRPHPHRLGVHHLAESRQPRRRRAALAGAARLRRAVDRDRADRPTQRQRRTVGREARGCGPRTPAATARKAALATAACLVAAAVRLRRCPPAYLLGESVRRSLVGSGSTRALCARRPAHGDAGLALATRDRAGARADRGAGPRAGGTEPHRDPRRPSQSPSSVTPFPAWCWRSGC